MRDTTLLRRLVGVQQLLVESVGFGLAGELVVGVRPRHRRPRCGRCGRRAPGYDRKPLRRWRHVGQGRTPVVLAYAPKRVRCARCGVRVEEVPWASTGSRFSRDFEELVAYLAQVTDKTKVTELTGISWRSVGEIVERVVARKLDPRRFHGLRRIGIDEFSYRKYHKYVTVVVDHDRKRVVWAAKGRGAEALTGFFERLGKRRCRQLRLVTLDMAGGYIKAVRESAAQAEIVFDRFHVERLAANALDTCRRELVRELAGTSEAKQVKKLRYILLGHPQRLTAETGQRLSDLQRSHKPLYRAYLLKESLAEALEENSVEAAARGLKSWMAWAARSRLKPFVKVGRTIRRHLKGILAYVRTGLTNAVVEGINTSLRMVARRAYGFHSARPLIAMLFLIKGGVQLDPPLPRPTQT